jgi:hypothetical protein
MRSNGRLRRPGRLGTADAVLDAGALAVAQLQLGDVGLGLVGDKTWKRCPSRSVNDSWAPGWGLAAADRAGAGWPGVQVDPAGQLHDLRAIPEGSVGLDRRRPGRFGHGQDRLAEVSIDRQADREPTPSSRILATSPSVAPAESDRMTTR